MTLIWFVVWFIANNVGGEEPLVLDPVNLWAGLLILAVALLVTYPFLTLATVTLAYLVLIPLGIHRYELRRRAWEASQAQAKQGAAAGAATETSVARGAGGLGKDPTPPTETRH